LRTALWATCAPRSATSAKRQLPGQLGPYSPGAVAETIACGPDPDRHAAKVEADADAGVDEAYVQQIGPDMAVFFAAGEKDVLPRFHT
jgi:hypothetical protein